MLIRIIYLAFFIFSGAICLAQVPAFKWANQFAGAANGQQAECVTVLTDSLGNIYTAGHFDGVFDFDPGAGTFTMAGAWWDIYFTKSDSSGNLIWAKQISGPDNQFLAALHLDQSGNIYLIGNFADATDFDPSANINILAPSTSTGVGLFFMKLDPQANLIWVKQLDPTPSSSSSWFDLTTDNQHNVYISGNFVNTVDFDPGAGTTTLTASSNTAAAVFVLKLNPQGALTWVKKLEGFFAVNIRVDNSGNVITAGWFGGTRDFDPGPSVYNLTAPLIMGGFISKLDNTGSFVWAKQLNSISMTVIYAMRLDCENNIYVAGKYRINMDADPGPGVTTYTSAPASDVQFLLKLDPSANLLWGGSLPNTEANYLHVDPAQNVYLTGNYVASSDLDIGSGTHVLTATNNDMFICRYNLNGSLAWAYGYSPTTILPGNASAIATDLNSHVLFGGSFPGTVDFDPSPSTHTLTAALSKREPYLVKFSQPQGFLAAAGASVICTGATASLNALSSGTLTWYNAPNSTSAIATGSTYVTPPLFTNTTFYVDYQGCGGAPFKTAITVTVTTCVDVIEEEYIGDLLTVYPNPSTGSFCIKGSVPSELAVISVLGQTLVEFSLGVETSYTKTIYELPEGVYFLQDKLSGRIYRQKIVVK